MNVESVLLAVLSADAPLLALATGGVWSFDLTGQKGLSRTLTPAAFDADGVIRPTVLLSARSANPGFNIQDDTGQVMDARQTVECYLFADGSYTPIQALKVRLYQLLHARRFAGLVRCEWAGDARLGRDLELDAFTERVDYLTTYIRAGS